MNSADTSYRSNNFKRAIPVHKSDDLRSGHCNFFLRGIIYAPGLRDEISNLNVPDNYC